MEQAGNRETARMEHLHACHFIPTHIGRRALGAAAPLPLVEGVSHALRISAQRSSPAGGGWGYPGIACSGENRAVQITPAPRITHHQSAVTRPLAAAGPVTS